MYLKLNGIEMQCTGSEVWSDLLSRLPDGGKGALGVCVGGKTFSLADPVVEYAFARVLTYEDEEGRRIYERSLQMLFLAAAERVFPGKRVRIGHSFGEGLFIDLPDITEDASTVKALESAMRALVEARLPIMRESVSREEAQAYYAQNGAEDRRHILDYRKIETFTFYNLDGYRDYFYGKMVPNTSYINVFALKAYADGLILAQPSRREPDRPAPFADLPGLMRTYSETADWNAILECQNVADLNDMVRHHKLRDFIRVNEALQEKKIAAIAQAFADSDARLLLIAGPSSSGKTTFAHRLAIALRVLGLKPVKISLDDYYIDRAKLPREADGSVDLETIDALDLPLINAHLPRLLAGETVALPEYDFKNSKRSDRTHALRVDIGQPIIIEGIHGLNERLTASVPADQKFKVYISALTMLNLDDHNRIRTTDARLLRRIVRDNLFRGTSPEQTMDMWPSVRRGEEKYIFPYQENANVMFNSSLVYELAIMKKYAYPILSAIQPSSPHYTLAGRLLKFLNYIETADVEDEIPVNSILREFIGGCCFYREED